MSHVPEIKEGSGTTETPETETETETETDTDVTGGPGAAEGSPAEKGKGGKGKGGKSRADKSPDEKAKATDEQAKATDEKAKATGEKAKADKRPADKRPAEALMPIESSTDVPRKGPKSKKKSRNGPKTRMRVGASPTDLVAPPEAEIPTFCLTTYGPDHYRSWAPTEAEALSPPPCAVRWLDIVGLGDIDQLRRVAEAYGLHPLALEDVVNLDQRPKAESFGECVFLVLDPVDPATGERGQISIFAGPGFVVTFQDRAGPWFAPVRTRIEQGRGRSRSAGADYLAYTLVDAVVDHYFPVLEALGDQLDALEEAVHLGQSNVLSPLAGLRYRLRQLRLTLWPTRDALAWLLRHDVPLFLPETIPYLRDAHDHAMRLADMVDVQRDAANNLFEVHLALSGQKLNEIMKILTVLSTIFLPLSFIAGVYGMNFERQSPWNMPELGWWMGYPFALGLMALTAGGLLWFFKRKGWLRAELEIEK